MRPLNVAVFPCGSEVGLEIHRSLKYYRHFKLIGLNSVQDYGEVLFEPYIGEVPHFKDESFFYVLRNIVIEHKIRFLIPAMDEVGFYLKKIEEELGCEIVYPDLKIANIIRRKTSTYDALKDIVNVPHVFTTINEMIQHFPIFLKPDIGYGSREAQKITSDQEILKFRGQFKKYVVTEYLPGKEYTIDCFSASNGQLLFWGARKRSRIRMGISVSTETVRDKKFGEFAMKISTSLNMKGAWFFQLKENKEGILTLLEVASRVSGSMALYRGLGVNFIALDLFQRLGLPVEIPKVISMKAKLERSFSCKLEMGINYETVYCDLDDCLVFEQKINTNLLRFLAQCINQGKKVILITRHADLPKVTLKKIRLDSFFDQIIHVQDRKISKASFIESTASIFIDDSYKERMDVATKLGIPVFAPDAIDLLISDKM